MSDDNCCGDTGGGGSCDSSAPCADTGTCVDTGTCSDTGTCIDTGPSETNKHNSCRNTVFERWRCLYCSTTRPRLLLRRNHFSASMLKLIEE